MPIYNRAHLIEETIESIKAQSYENWECIIVDDGSSDITIAVIQKLIDTDTRFQLFNRPIHIQKGPSACRNYAITKMKGDYIQFFDSDDMMHLDHLHNKINKIGNSDIVVCRIKEFKGGFNNAFYTDDSGNQLHMPQDLFKSFVSGSFPMFMVAPLWRKSSLLPYIPIREDLHILEDHELYARALFDKKKCEIINKNLIYYRTGLPSSTQEFFKRIDTGLHSFFEAKRTVLRLIKEDEVKLAVLKMTLGFF
jgi:glycosyltransferase involved in cell wall biosynthesis